MPVQARRVFRFGLTLALSLAAAYGLAFPLPFLAPILVVILCANPGQPLGLRGLLGLVLVVLITTGVGLLLIPLLTHYPMPALLLIAIGIYLSNYLTVNLGKGMVGALLTMGFTIIPAAGLVEFVLGVEVIKALVLALGLAIASLWLVYPWFPEDPDTTAAQQPATSDTDNSNWIALRATIIVLPPFLMALANPAMYIKVIMKVVALGQQGTEVSARDAGRELMGSTFLGGGYAVLFWVVLKLYPNLWMFFWWMLLFGIYFACKLYGLISSRFPPSFWVNVVVTLLILLGSAVQDSANGQDVYQAFAVRMGLFIALTLYAWLAIYLLEQLRARRLGQRSMSRSEMETDRC